MLLRDCQSLTLKKAKSFVSAKQESKPRIPTRSSSIDKWFLYRFYQLFSFIFYRFHPLSFHFTMFYALVLHFLCFQVIISVPSKEGQKMDKMQKRQRIRILHTKTKGLLRSPVMPITGHNRHIHPWKKTKGFLRPPVMAIMGHNRQANFLPLCFLFWPDSIYFKAFDCLDSTLFYF